MFAKKTQTEPTALETEIARLLSRAAGMSPESDEYAKIATQIVALHKLKEAETSYKRVSYDELVKVAGSLVGVLAVINYERIHVITTKALGFVMKTR